MPYLQDPMIDFEYGKQKRGASSTYQRGIAQADFDQGKAAQGYGRTRSDLIRQFGEMRDKMPAAYNRRNMLRSGIYQRGLQTQAADQLRGLGRADEDYAQTQAGFGLQRQQLEGSRNDAMAEAEEYRQKMIQNMVMRAFGAQF